MQQTLWRPQRLPTRLRLDVQYDHTSPDLLVNLSALVLDQHGVPMVGGVAETFRGAECDGIPHTGEAIILEFLVGDPSKLRRAVRAARSQLRGVEQSQADRWG